MRILTRYILRAHIGPFFFALSVLTSILFINTVARRFEELAGKGLSFGVIVEVFVLSVPHIVALTLPMAVLVSVLYAFSQLAVENEITALKASGVNLVAMLRPLLVAGVILAGFMVYFNDSILPETNHELKNLLSDIGRKSPTLELREQTINEIRGNDGAARYYLQAAQIDPATNRMRDVVIYDLSIPSQPRTVYADSGRLAFNETQTNLLLILHDGWMNQLEEGRAGFRRVLFSQQMLEIPGVNNMLERNQTDYRSDREMSLGQLGAQIDTARMELDSVRSEAVHYAEAVVQRALAGPVPVRTEAESRLFPPPSAGLTAGEPFDAVNRDIDGSGDYLIDRVTRETNAFASRARTLQRRINEYSVEWHKKWAIPFACIVFVMVGAPLAVRFPRGGAGMVIMTSLVIFAIYYMSLIGGESLGDAGHILPFVGPWLPNLAFFVVALWALSRIGRESSSTRGGGWDDLITTTRNFLLRPLRRRRTRTTSRAAGEAGA